MNNSHFSDIPIDYNLVEEGSDDSDYGSDYDSTDENETDIYDRIAKYWMVKDMYDDKVL